MTALFSHQPLKKILPATLALLLAVLCVMGARGAAGVSVCSATAISLTRPSALPITPRH